MNVPPAAHNGAQAQTSRYVFLGCGEELRWAEPPTPPLPIVLCIVSFASSQFKDVGRI